MTLKFNKIINEYMVGTQNTIPKANISIPSMAIGKDTPPDTGTGFGHTKKHKKAIKNDKKLRKKYAKQIPRTL